MLAQLPTAGRLALRERALFMFLYNTGARVQEVADVRIGDLDLDGSPRVRLHGKGDKWRTCPLWKETANLLKTLLQQRPMTDASGRRRLPFAERHAFDSLRDLQDRATPHRRTVAASESNKPATPQPTRIPTYRGRASVGVRGGGERHSQLARTREPGDNQPLRGDHDPNERRSFAGLRTDRPILRRDTRENQSGETMKPSCLGSIPCNNYVPRITGRGTEILSFVPSHTNERSHMAT